MMSDRKQRNEGETKMTTINRSEAWQTGYEAHEQGEPRSAVAEHCPAGGWNAEQWLSGWDAAESGADE